MLDKFIETVRRNNMFQRGDGIVVGISGGPDSTCLLHLLWRIREKYQLRLYGVHLNHQFRGEEALEDAEYVKRFCEQLDIPLFSFSENVALYSKNKGITFEEAGREIRYNLFYRVMEETNASKIAVAQNMDDQAETVLMRLMRGAGIEGLSAIDYVREQRIIRPLLDISRIEIEQYCQYYQLEPRIDKTNLSAIYTRNRIRLELLPYIEKHFNHNIKNTLSRTANLLREDKEFIRDVVDTVYDRTVHKKNGEIRIEKKTFLENHRVIRKRLLREALREINGNLKDIESKHVDQLMDLMENGRIGSVIDLPRAMEALPDYEGLIIRTKKNNMDDVSFEYNVNIGETIDIRELNGSLSSEIIECRKEEEMNDEGYGEAFDFNKVKASLILRSRRPGDRFSPLGMTGSKKLKDFFIDQKIPRQMRDKIPLLCDGSEIMWVIGYRLSEKYKVNRDTKKILMVTYYPSSTGLGCRGEE